MTSITDLHIAHASGSAFAAAPQVGAPQRRVLHIDGDGGSALLLAMLLMPEAHVTHVSTLAAATRAIRRGGYNLVVLDPELPDGDGAPLLELLQCSDAPPPVLLYTARESLWRGAADAALLKPAASARQLARTLAQLFDGAAAAACTTQP